jgi:hypothetical protein
VNEAQRTLLRLGAYLRELGFADWAHAVETLPPDGEAARALTERQREHGFPERYRPRFAFGARHSPLRRPPSRGALREFVADEGKFRPEEIFPPELLAHRPEDLEPRVVAVAWTRFRRTAPGLKVGWHSGSDPLERVEVEETAERVTITLYERRPGTHDVEGRPAFQADVGRTRCVDVPLAAPLGGRVLIDGATGRHPEAIDATGTAARDLRAAGDVDFAATECEPLP